MAKFCQIWSHWLSTTLKATMVGVEGYKHSVLSFKTNIYRNCSFTCKTFHPYYSGKGHQRQTTLDNDILEFLSSIFSFFLITIWSQRRRRLRWRRWLCHVATRNELKWVRLAPLPSSVWDQYGHLQLNWQINREFWVWLLPIKYSNDLVLAYGQCDQMASLFIQCLAICCNENLPKSITICKSKNNILPHAK